MNNKSLLAAGIALLYRESQITDKTDNSAKLVRKAINDIKTSNINLGVGVEKGTITALKEFVLKMCEEPPAHVFSIDELRLQLQIICEEEERLYDTIMSSIDKELSQDKIKSLCINLRKSINGHHRDKKLKEVFNKASAQMSLSSGEIENMKVFLDEFVMTIDEYRVNSDVRDPAIVAAVNMSDIEDVKNVFQYILNESDDSLILKTGWQGLNRALDGGIRRGEEIIIGALQHNYKTGFSLTLFKQLAMYNKPFMLDANKKPCMIRISFEDTLNLNYTYLYSNIIQNAEGRIPDLSEINPAEAQRIVTEVMQQTGYTIFTLEVNPHKWTYMDLLDYLIQKDAEGYEVHVCMVDYLLKLPTTGCTGNSTGEDIRNLFERIKAYTSSKRIAFITPHQLSTEAKGDLLLNPTGFVKRLVGSGRYAGCKQIDQVVDLEIFIHIEVVNGSGYLTIQRGKHRKDQYRLTPEEDRYFVLPFHTKGCILDDLGKAEITRKYPGGGAVGTSEEVPYWETVL